MSFLGDVLVVVHLLFIIVWLGTDLAVFGLSFSALNRSLPIAIRIDRVKVAQTIDRYVLIAFLSTTPVGLALAWARDLAVFDSPRLTAKLALMAVIFLLAVLILTGAAGTTQLLERIAAASATERDGLEAELRRRVITMAYPVLAIYALMIVMIAISTHRGG
jgi:hypothetical protein